MRTRSLQTEEEVNKPRGQGGKDLLCILKSLKEKREVRMSQELKPVINEGG